MQDAQTIKLIRRKYRALRVEMDERGRRQWAAVEAQDWRTPGEVLKSLSAIQSVDVHVPITDGRELIMPRYTEPEAQQEMILEKLNLQLPKQPPPRIRSGEIIMPPDPST